MKTSTTTGVFLLATDTVPGIAAVASTLTAGTGDHPILSLPSSIASHPDLTTAPPGRPVTSLTWHAPAADAVMSLLGATSPIMRRAAARLWPGPVTLAIGLDASARAAVDRVGGLGHAVDASGALWVRVPGNDSLRRWASTLPGPLLARGVPDDRGALCLTLAGARARLQALGLHATEPIEDHNGAGVPSTVVRLNQTGGGGFKVERVGPVSAEAVRQRLTATVLFVCTGNTCRSPMAERIARHLSERLAPGSVPVEALSAGVSALEGEPTTPEALTALRRMGIEARSGGARALDRSLLARADLVLAMTRAHLRAVQQAGAPSAQLLDPDGDDVPDPIGGSQQQYDATAQRLAELIAARLKELQA